MISQKDIHKGNNSAKNALSKLEKMLELSMNATVSNTGSIARFNASSIKRENDDQNESNELQALREQVSALRLQLDRKDEELEESKSYVRMLEEALTELRATNNSRRDNSMSINRSFNSNV